jgi:hypothetical protein
MTTTVAPPAAALTLSGLAPSLLQSCILAPTPAVPPTIGDNDIYTPVAPGVTYAALPTVTIVDTSPTQVIGCANDVGTTPQQTLNALFPAAVTGDGVVDRATNDFWVYDGTTWNNVGPNPGPTIVDATIIPPWNEILSYDATVRTKLQIQSLDYALALLTEPDPIGVVLGLDARRVRIVAAPALTFTLAPQTPQVSVGARVNVPVLALQLTQHEPLLLNTLPAANLTLAANAPTVSAGVAVAAPLTSITLAPEPPERAGPGPTAVFVPFAGFGVLSPAPTVATGASVSPAALALEISAVAPSTFIPVTATGGDSVTDITAEGINYRVHAFTTIGTSSLVVTAGGSVDYLVVGGGGGGGSRQGGGGGGGGGLLTGTNTLSADTYTVTVGGGGDGGPNTAAADGSNGSNSVFGLLTAIGGGGGGRALASSADTAGVSGGSGGGAGRSGTSTVGGAGTSGQGNSGGANLGTNDGSGGGGGASAAGQDRVASPLSSGNGGAGLFVTAFAGFGDGGYFAGGGGGGSETSSGALSGAGGIGGGGDGAGQAGISTAGNGENGVANTGGGGGGAQGTGAANRSGGNGGSGVVLIRYRI